MSKIAAREAKNKFGQLLDTAQRSPVTIEKKGRAVAVLMSVEEYERLEAAEDTLWYLRAQEAAKDGFLTTEESEKFLAELGNDKN